MGVQYDRDTQHRGHCRMGTDHPVFTVGSSAVMNETNMMHGQHWNGEDLTGWTATEKFDGCRAFWDGNALWSRGGLSVQVPDSWKLPAGISLDGEIFAGYGRRQLANNLVRHGRHDDSVRFIVFDCPSARGDYAERLESIPAGIERVEVWTVPSTAHALQLMHDVQANGGEGLMLRHPAIEYHPGRSSRLLKLKSEVIA